MSSPPAAAAPFDQFLEQLDAGMAASHPDDDSTTNPDQPSWLRQVIAMLYDGQDAAAAKGWALRVHGELERLNGRVPLAVVHDWHAHGVVPMLVEANARHGGSAEPQQVVGRLHTRALAGEHILKGEWNAALLPALRDVYRLAYAYADAFSKAYAGAHAYAIDNDYGEERADEFARTYAELNTTANAGSFADANALAHASAVADAFAAADAPTYAEAWPFAHVQVYAHACAHQDRSAADGRSAAEDGRLRAAYRHLADRLTDSLARAAA